MVDLFRKFQFETVDLFGVKLFDVSLKNFQNEFESMSYSLYRLNRFIE